MLRERPRTGGGGGLLTERDCSGGENRAERCRPF